jgi:cytochrome c-type biogenesis protein
VPDLGYQLTLALALGLLGFIEPCSLGAHLLFLRFIEGKGRVVKLQQVAIFATTRALFIGGLGTLAALLGQRFFTFQRGGWLLLGVLYTALGVIYLSGKTSRLLGHLGPSAARLSHTRSSAALGLLFGLNIPACAAPLLLVVLSTVALDRPTLVQPALIGFLILAVFGLALSLPLAALVIWPWTAAQLDRLMQLARASRVLISSILLALGLWSILFALSTTTPT